MTIQDFVHEVRARWITVCIAVVVSVGIAVGVTLLTTPLYQASTRLYVATSATSDIYADPVATQKRVISYTTLLTGTNLARRTIDKLHLDMSIDALQEKVKATTAPNTVLIEVSVLDPSPERARDIANALSDEFVLMVRELETPPDSDKPDARVVVDQHATLPTKPAIPKTARNLALGLGLGLVLGAGLASSRSSGQHRRKRTGLLE